MSPMRPIATAQIAPYPIEMTKRRETITGRNAKLCIGTNKKKIAKTKVDKKKSGINPLAKEAQKKEKRRTDARDAYRI